MTTSVAAEMTLTVAAFQFATKTSPSALSYATPRGSAPTGTVATTVFVASDITLTLSDPVSVTNSSPNAGSYPIV